MNWVNASELDGPLTHIMQAETEAASRLRAAQEASETKIKQARQQALELKRKALELGKSEGQRDANTRIAAAQTEAAQIVAAAHEGTRRFEHLPQDEANRLIEHALERVTGLRHDGGQP